MGGTLGPRLRGDDDVNSIAGIVEKYPSGKALARAAAESFAERARDRIRESGRFSVALTGGDSPRELYQLLGNEERGIPWEGVHLFWGDDRCVPPRHPRSNYRLAHDLFISKVPIPSSNVHRIRGELSPEAAAAAYARELEAYFGGGTGSFDLVHLGLGDDGHIASLFPFDLPRLTDRAHGVLTSVRMPIGEPRVTLSLPLINAAARVEFLVPKPSKEPIARRAMNGPLDPFRIPAQGVRPAGELVWRIAF